MGARTGSSPQLGWTSWEDQTVGLYEQRLHGQLQRRGGCVQLRQSELVDTGLVRKYSNRVGYALNVEQEINIDIGAFLKWSHNDGRKETFDFTDVNQSLATGFSMKGDLWGRVQDTVGLGWVNNKLSQQAKDYFQSGGLGILIGDGRLNYKDENITEIFYNCNVMKSVFLTMDYQRVVNPAYNKDRGPANVLGFRLHVDLL